MAISWRLMTFYCGKLTNTQPGTNIGRKFLWSTQNVRTIAAPDMTIVFRDLWHILSLEKGLLGIQFIFMILSCPHITFHTYYIYRSYSVYHIFLICFLTPLVNTSVFAIFKKRSICCYLPKYNDLLALVYCCLLTTWVVLVSCFLQKIATNLYCISFYLVQIT